MAAWIFQANPKTFDVDRYLRTFRDITWTVKPRRAIDPGDRAFIWRADGTNKGSGGIVAIGWVTGSPQLMPEDDNAIPLWKSRLDLATDPTTLRVPIRIDEVRLTTQEGMLLRTEIEEHPMLRDLQILHYRAVIVCLVRPLHESAIMQLWDKSR